MSNLNERIAVEVHGYMADETQHLVMNKDQLFMNAYMAEEQYNMLEEAIDKAQKNHQFENAQIPVYCELSLYSDPDSEEKRNIPVFTEFNLATHANEFRTLSYTEAIEARNQFRQRMKDLKEQCPDYDSEKEKMDTAVKNQLDEYQKIFSTTEAAVGFKQNNIHRLEAINTQAQIKYGKNLDESIMTYATKNASGNLVKLGYNLEKAVRGGEKLFGLRPSDRNMMLSVVGINAYGQKIDEVYQLRDELVDKAVRCGRSVGAVVENVVNFGEKTAEKINNAMYDNFVHTLTVAMSYSDKFKRIAERFLPQEEFEQACAKAENLRQFRKEVDSPLRDFLEASAETVKTPFQIAVGIGYVINEELGVSEHLKKAASYAKTAYEVTRDNINEKKEIIAEKVDTAIKKVDEAFIKAVDTVLTVPENVKKGFDRFLDKARNGGSEFIQTLKEFNEIGKSALDRTPRPESKELAENLINLHVEVGGDETFKSLSSSEKFKAQIEQAENVAASILDKEPAYALYSLDSLYNKVAKLDEQSFESKYSKSFNKVLSSVAKCGMDNAPKDIKEFAETTKAVEAEKPVAKKEEKKPKPSKTEKAKSTKAVER